MAWRSRTREFVDKRGGYVRRNGGRSRFGAGGGSGLGGRDYDRVPLVGDAGDDMELGMAGGRQPDLPPEWVDFVDEGNEYMNQIRTRMDSLKTLHVTHVTSLKRGAETGEQEERGIEILTQEITTLFHRCQKTIQVIGRKGNATGSDQQKRLTLNIQRTLAKDLQDLSGIFRTSQSDYLKKVRETNSSTRGKIGGGQAAAAAAAFDDDIDDDDIFSEPGFTTTQQQHLRDNTSRIRQRDEEITNIVKSISELSTIFKDLATLIVDQGTILDRIDYNIENASYSVDEGRKALEEGEKYQKKATKKIIIVLLVLVVVAMVFVTIFVKKNK